MKKMKKQVENDVTFEEGCDQYLMNCRARNLREGTIKHYKESMQQLFKHIDPSTPISSFGKHTMDTFIID